MALNFQPGNTIGEQVEQDGKIWEWDGEKWVISTTPLGGSVDLDYVPNPTSGVVTNTGGTPAIVTARTDINAGLMLPDDIVDLDPIKDDINNIQIDIENILNALNVDAYSGLPTIDDCCDDVDELKKEVEELKKELQELIDSLEVDAYSGEIPIIGEIEEIKQEIEAIKIEIGDIKLELSVIIDALDIDAYTGELVVVGEVEEIKKDLDDLLEAVQIDAYTGELLLSLGELSNVDDNADYATDGNILMKQGDQWIPVEIDFENGTRFAGTIDLTDQSVTDPSTLEDLKHGNIYINEGIGDVNDLWDPEIAENTPVVGGEVVIYDASDAYAPRWVLVEKNSEFVKISGDVMTGTLTVPDELIISQADDVTVLGKITFHHKFPIPDEFYTLKVKKERLVYNCFDTPTSTVKDKDIAFVEDIKVDLSYTPASNKGTVVNTKGNDVDLPAVNSVSAGLMTPDMLAVLEDLETDAYQDDNVDLDYAAASDKGTILNSDGEDAEIPVVDQTNAGLMTPDMLAILEDLEVDAYQDDNVDLDYTAAADKGTILNSDGDDAEIPLVNETIAGLMSPEMLSRLDSLEEDAYGDDAYQPEYVRLDGDTMTGDLEVPNLVVSGYPDDANSDPPTITLNEGELTAEDFIPTAEYERFNTEKHPGLAGNSSGECVISHAGDYYFSGNGIGLYYGEDLDDHKNWQKVNLTGNPLAHVRYDADEKTYYLRMGSYIYKTTDFVTFDKSAGSLGNMNIGGWSTNGNYMAGGNTSGIYHYDKATHTGRKVHSDNYRTGGVLWSDEIQRFIQSRNYMTGYGQFNELRLYDIDGNKTDTIQVNVTGGESKMMTHCNPLIINGYYYYITNTRISPGRKILALKVKLSDFTDVSKWEEFDVGDLPSDPKQLYDAGKHGIILVCYSQILYYSDLESLESGQPKFVENKVLLSENGHTSNYYGVNGGYLSGLVYDDKFISTNYKYQASSDFLTYVELGDDPQNLLWNEKRVLTVDDYDELSEKYTKSVEDYDDLLGKYNDLIVRVEALENP